MRLEQRSYRSQTLRPKPEIHIEADGELSIIATPWGARSSAQKVIQTIQDFVLSARHDQEVTSPFQRLSCLSPLGNNLRIALMLANDVLFREDNKDEYTAGVETFAMVRSECEILWASIGFPQIFMSRQSTPLMPLSGCLDMSADLSPSSQLLPPLPGQLIGLESTSNFSVQGLRPQQGDKIILLSRSSCPSDFYQIQNEHISLDGLSQALAEDNPEMPYWLGILDVDRS